LRVATIAAGARPLGLPAVPPPRGQAPAAGPPLVPSAEGDASQITLGARGGKTRQLGISEPEEKGPTPENRPSVLPIRPGAARVQESDNSTPSEAGAGTIPATAFPKGPGSR